MTVPFFLLTKEGPRGGPRRRGEVTQTCGKDWVPTVLREDRDVPEAGRLQKTPHVWGCLPGSGLSWRRGPAMEAAGTVLFKGLGSWPRELGLPRALFLLPREGMSPSRERWLGLSANPCSRSGGCRYPLQ